MKVGYFSWGYQGDHKILGGKEVNSPDGCYFYVHSLINALTEKGHEVHWLAPDRDEEAVALYGANDFTSMGSYAQQRRWKAYNSLTFSYAKFPDLDVVVLEHRWKIPGRNTEVSIYSPDYQPDLDIFDEIIDHYKGKSLIIVSDQDYQMGLEELDKYDIVFDWGKRWTTLLPANTYHVDTPFDFSIYDRSHVSMDKLNGIVYVGNRYDRDWTIDKYLAPISDKIDINMYGNWLEKERDSRDKWPNIKFHGRIKTENFFDIYKFSAATPLLAKDSYCNHSLMTCRLHECLLYGSIPVGINEFIGISKYLPSNLIANDAEELLYIAKHVSKDIIYDLRSKLKFMDASEWVNVFEKAVAGKEPVNE